MIQNQSQSLLNRRLQRFLAEISFDPRDLARALVCLMALRDTEKWTLILDRTNWKFGAIHLNVLYSGGVY